MRTNSKLRNALIIYAIILYGLWSLLELYLKSQLGINEFTKEVYIKLVVWLLPAILIHLHFSDNMFIKKEEMYFLRKSGWISVPIMLLFTIYIFISEYLTNSKIMISDSFGISTVVEVISIAIGEEMDFQGTFFECHIEQ